MYSLPCSRGLALRAYPRTCSMWHEGYCPPCLGIEGGAGGSSNARMRDRLRKVAMS